MAAIALTTLSTASSHSVSYSEPVTQKKQETADPAQNKLEIGLGRWRSVTIG